MAIGSVIACVDIAELALMELAQTPIALKTQQRRLAAPGLQVGLDSSCCCGFPVTVVAASSVKAKPGMLRCDAVTPLTAVKTYL